MSSYSLLFSIWSFDTCQDFTTNNMKEIQSSEFATKFVIKYFMICVFIVHT